MRDVELLKYISAFDVRENDPALLPEYRDKSWNRAQFAYQYLRSAIKDRNYEGNMNFSYTKNNPGWTIRSNYFEHVKERCIRDKHIISFQMFLNAFV